MAEDLTLKEKSTYLQSRVKSSNMMQSPLSYIPSISDVYPKTKALFAVSTGVPSFVYSVSSTRYDCGCS